MPELNAVLSVVPPTPSNHPRVLLVDDDASVLDTLTQVLECNDFAVEAAHNVHEALALIASQTFDVLVSDLHMPDQGDGLTVVSAMRHSSPKAITVIFSAYPETKHAADAIVRQTDEIVVKSLGIENLVSVIRERLQLGVNYAARVIESVADILERNTQATIEDWLACVRDEPEVLSVQLDDDARCAYLTPLFREVIARLRAPVPLGQRAPLSAAAAQHGIQRRRQGYSAAMLVEESRMLQVSIFQTLQDNLSRIDFSVLLVGVMAIADEVDCQLAQQMAAFISDSTKDMDDLGAWVATDPPQRNVA